VTSSNTAIQPLGSKMAALARPCLLCRFWTWNKKTVCWLCTYFAPL